MVREDHVSVSDGRLPLPVWLPESASGPGILLIQEIFGLDDYLTSVATDLAASGYVVAVPELFWRLSPGWSASHDEQGVTASLSLASEFDTERGESDVLAALEHLRGLPEVVGGAGLLGFCLGGSLAFAAAARGNPDAVVSFYGSSVPDRTSLLNEVTCPVQFHFGGKDPYIPRDAVQRVVDAVDAHPCAEVHVQEDAGHAFHNHSAPMFHEPDAARKAWHLTQDFLARALPTSGSR
jgi:carboxymethylenebutenolidase